MEENEKLYKFGVTGYDWLKIRGSSYIDSSLLLYGVYRIIECDINDKSMKVRFCNWKEENWNKMDMSELQRDSIIDIDDNGSHWEGDCMKGLPYGYGKLFNEENVLIYKGFMYKVEKMCYGEEYYKENGSLQYQGTFYNNKRSGYGILYDKKKNILYEGDWSDGAFCTPLCECNEFDVFAIHSFVERIIIHDFYTIQKTFAIVDYPRLQSIAMTTYPMPIIVEYEIKNCPALMEISINEIEYNNINNIIKNPNNDEYLSVISIPFHKYNLDQLDEGDNIISRASVIREFDSDGQDYQDEWEDNNESVQKQRICSIMNCNKLSRLVFSEVYDYEMKLSNCSCLTDLFIDGISLNNYKEFRLENYPNLSSLVIAKRSFEMVETIVFSNLPSLSTIVIGCDSFANVQDFSLSNLPSLKSLIIREFSFQNCRTINISGRSFKEIKKLDLPSLQSLRFGPSSFTNTKTMTLSNLPALVFINICGYSIINIEHIYLSSIIHICESCKEIPFVNGCFRHFNIYEPCEWLTVDNIISDEESKRLKSKISCLCEQFDLKNLYYMPR